MRLSCNTSRTKLIRRSLPPVAAPGNSAITALAVSSASAAFRLKLPVQFAPLLLRAPSQMGKFALLTMSNFASAEELGARIILRVTTPVRAKVRLSASAARIAM